MELTHRKKRSLYRKLVMLPVTGASVHVIQKFLFELEAQGTNGVHKFHKPLFFTWLGSCGMFITFCVHLIGNYKSFCSKCNKGWWKPIAMLGSATIFNLTAGALSNVSMLYLNYSVSLMLRSSTVIFGALLSVFYLKRPLMQFQLLGVGLAIVAIFLVGISALGSGSHTTHREASTIVITAYIIVRTLSKSLQAIAMILEERAMEHFDLTPVEVSGISGVWSLAMATVFLLPFEDTKDTFYMLWSSRVIRWLCIASVVVFGLWNVLAMQVTKKASAVSRMIFDQLTIVVVWVVQLSVHWAVKGTEMEGKYGKTGEVWTPWSWLQLLGFGIMVLGAAVYQKFVVCRWIKYY